MVNLTQTELEAGVALQAGKLALLINSMPVDDEIKSTFLHMAEEATFEQLQEMINFLERQYLNVATYKIDEKFAKDIADLQKEHEGRLEELNADLFNKLKEIENKL